MRTHLVFQWRLYFPNQIDKTQANKAAIDMQKVLSKSTAWVSLQKQVKEIEDKYKEQIKGEEEELKKELKVEELKQDIFNEEKMKEFAKGENEQR